VLPAEPNGSNLYRADLVLAVLRSYDVRCGQPLLARARGESAAEYALRAYVAPFALLAHDAAATPRFTYANQTAQRLFERDWNALVGLPSHLSAEPDAREARLQLLERVQREGYCNDYTGVRISASGRRFTLIGGSVWTVSNGEGQAIGQAAAFADWAEILH